MTTGLRRVRPCAPPLVRSGSKSPHASSSASRSQHPRLATNSEMRLMRLCAPLRRNRVRRSVSSGQTSASSQASSSGSARSMGARSMPARQTICGSSQGSGVFLSAVQGKIGRDADAGPAGEEPGGGPATGPATGPAFPAGEGEVADRRDDPAGAGSGVRADGMFRLPVRRMRTTANARDGIRILSGCTWFYLRPPTFWRPGWSLTLHGLDKRRSSCRRIAV